ncbi:2-amino-4-hydroxy-6-hydroxymethyldihydropteridine diphosphokinase [Flavobacterium sp. W21_SRS_FM6]|uniref:2-amino-4-hydroxy-6- hydroxymethyldihydropteridine diphosphokinase n=1 Tax=Flavobacterium sp. W21_SRS_FM6 TaxID=3240268 RepID=UPI003F912D55
MPHTIYISIGSNIEREKYTKAGLQGLYENFGELLLSRVYESESVGFQGSHFYNLVAKAQTNMSIEAVCQVLKLIEEQNKRERSTEKFSPRTLDLDLLLFDKVISNDSVELPRPEILYNAFVLQPLAEIAPHDIHPIAKKTYAVLWQEYDKTQQHLWPIEFNWRPL